MVNQNPVYQWNWQNPATEPEVGNQTGYPLVATIKNEHAKNYAFHSATTGYNTELKCVVINAKVGVNAEAMHKVYYTNDGEKQEQIDLSALKPLGESVAAKDVTLTLNETNPTQNVSNVQFNKETKQLSYTLANTSTAIDDMAVISFNVTAKNQISTIFKVNISTIERPDMTSIDTAIEAAKNAENGIITDDRAASSVEKGTKFVTAEEMKALHTAMQIAEAAKLTVTTTAQAAEVAKALNDAIATFNAAIKIGTYIDMTMIDTAIEAVKNAETGIITDDRAASSVENGTKFVTAEEMKALHTAMQIAEAAKLTVTTTAQATEVAKALNDAIATFNAAIKTGTYTKPSGGDDDNDDNDDSSSGSGSSTTTPTSPPAITDPTLPTQGDVNPPVSMDGNGNATIKIPDDKVQEAIKKASEQAQRNGTTANGIAITVTLDVKITANSLTATLSRSTLDSLIASNVEYLSLPSDFITLRFDLEALKQMRSQSTDEVIIKAVRQDVKKLSVAAQTTIGSRPAMDITVWWQKDGGMVNITNFGNGNVSIGIPYTKTVAEQTGYLCGVYVDANGKLTYLPRSSYNTASKTMLVSTNHLSVYGVAYKTNTPIFTDTANHWAKEDIDFVAARGLLSGTTTTTFSPNSPMTRGMLAKSLTTLSGKEMTTVVGGNMSNAITRAEMAVIMQNYAKAIGYKLPSVHAKIVFTDNASIGNVVKEMQMAGILMGKDGGKFDPTGTATRAEVSAMLRRFVELVSDSETAKGWITNDSGSWMYFENGKAVTGKKAIDGKSYEFDQYGVTTAISPERKYGVYTVQKGESFWSIARKYKVSMFELATANGKSIFSIIHTGEELRIPQK